jgi:hypothetical protein
MFLILCFSFFKRKKIKKKVLAGFSVFFRTLYEYSLFPVFFLIPFEQYGGNIFDGLI